MTPSDPRTERRITAILVAAVNIGVVATLLWLYVTIQRTVMPRAAHVPLWVEIGYPVATCMAAAHFGRRAWHALKRFRAP